jgi:hypothetical protein
MAFINRFAVIIFLGPLLCSCQVEFDPLDYGLPALLSSSDSYVDLCENFPPLSGPALPTDLPRQFSVHVEANILNKNRTVLVHEFYDDVNNRGSISSTRNGVREHAIFDYEKNELFVFPDSHSGRACSVQSVTGFRGLNFSFGITRRNGSIHIGTTSDFLGLLNNDVPTQFLGSDSVRGTPALHWRACINAGPFASFYADYYYTTTDGWSPSSSSSEGLNQILSQIVVRGNTFNDTVRNFYHIYSAFSFQSGPESVPERAFTVPTGLACVGRNPGLPVPKVPDYFTTYVQYVDTSSEMKQVTTVRVSVCVGGGGGGSSTVLCSLSPPSVVFCN